MTKTPEYCIPKNLREISERLLESKDSWPNIPGFATPLLDWLVGEGVTQLIEDIGWEYAIEPSSLNAGWCDSELPEYLVDLPAKQPITDKLRVECAKGIIDWSINELGLEDWMCVHAYPLPTSEKPQAYLCCTSEIAGQAGAQFQFHGVFKSKDAILENMRDLGLWLLSDVASLSDREILQFWNNDNFYIKPALALVK
jgi:hypothetical protein